MEIIKCDRCGVISTNPKKDKFCKVLVYKGLKWQRLGRGTHYTHHHFCKKCKKELFK